MAKYQKPATPETIEELLKLRRKDNIIATLGIIKDISKRIKRLEKFAILGAAE